jgi:hypothetical protein
MAIFSLSLKICENRRKAVKFQNLHVKTSVNGPMVFAMDHEGFVMRSLLRTNKK